MRKQSTLLLFTLLLSSHWLSGQIPTGYYNTATGLTGAPLKTALYDIIKGHTALSYTALWTAFQTTDKKPDGKVWDMYSNCSFTFVADECGNYSSECDCYNREHSWPKSWFNDATPMYSDLFHLVPTDGKVNGMRSNYPFGEVSNPTYTSGNGSKLGPCSFPGYTGIVFEPIDEYKGDFARNYFYMATRYENIIAGWHSNDANAEAILLANSYPVFETWFLNLLTEWHTNDPVSQKEIDRNNVVYYSFQHNRNPYIDHPEYVGSVWGGTTVLPEPTNHVLSFAVNTATTTTLSLSWNDNDGLQPASKFLLAVNTSGTFTSPVDGTPVADDLNLADNNGSINVNHGVQAYTLSGLTPGTLYYFKIWPYTNTGANTNYKTDGTVPQTSGTTLVPASLTVNPNTLSGFTYVAGSGPSISQSYTLSGTGLTPASGNITVTGSTHYEVSTNNSTFSNSLNVAYTGGALSSAPVYVRLKAGFAAGTYNNEIVGNSGGGASAVNVTCNGSVSQLVATLTANPTSLSGFSYVSGSGPSASQSYAISGIGLTPSAGNITVTGSTDYEVSSNNSTFSSSVSVPYTSSTLASTPVYVRLKSGLAAGTYNSEIVSNTGGGATAVTVTCSGSVSLPSSILTANPTSLSGFTYVSGSGPSPSQNYTISGTGLMPSSGNITVTGSTHYEVSTNNSTFSSFINLAYSGTVLSSTPVYVRLKSGVSAGTYNNEIVSNAGGGAASANVTCNGSVTPPPAALTANPTTLSGFSYVTGSGPSASQSYTISGIGLTPLAGNISVTSPADYEISLNNSAFSNSVNMAYSGGTLSSAMVYVRLKSGLDEGNYNNEIVSNSGGGAAAVNVTCNGNVTNVDLPQISISSPLVAPANVTAGTDNHIIYISKLDVTILPATLLQVSYHVNGTYSDGDIKPNGFQLYCNTVNNFSSAVQLGTTQSSNLSGTAGLHIFGSLNKVIANGNSLFIWLTADISAVATPLHNIIVAATTNASYIFSAGNKTGTQSAGGIQTIVTPGNALPGDIAFTAYQTSDPDKFSFVLLKDFAAGVNLKFTDCAWNETELLNTEGTLSWFVPAGGLPKGTVVTVTINGSPAVTHGSISQSGSFQLSASGDQILAFQGESAAPQFIAGISSGGWISSGDVTSSTSYLPQTLSLYDNATGFADKIDNGYYSGPETATAEALRALLNFPVNYTRANTILTFPDWQFPVSTSTRINVNSEVQNIHIQAGQVLEIEANHTFTVHGNLTNTNGTNGLILKSEASGTGSLLHNTDGVSATVQRYISGDLLPDQHLYHLVSIPLEQSSAILSGLFADSYLYQFDESAATINSSWIDLGNGTTTPLEVNRGYRLNYPSAPGIIYNLTGQLNNGEFTVPVNFTNAEKGYNLVPNPYPSAIDWDASSGWNRSELTSAIWTWNQNAGNYSAYVNGGSVNGGSRFIPAGQSFFVQTTANLPFSMNNEVRLHSNAGFAKSTETEVNSLYLLAEANNYSDELLVRFNGSATGNYDTEWDAHKIEGTSEAPQFGSVSNDGHSLSINTLQASGAEEIIPLNFTLNSNSVVTFTGSGIESFDPMTSIHLEDILLNKVTDLRINPKYSFSYEPGNASGRFLLRFSSLTGKNDDVIAVRGTVFFRNGFFYVNIPTMENKLVEIGIYNAIGQQLTNSKIVMTGSVQIPAPSGTGIYILKIHSGTDFHSQKIVVPGS